MQLLGRDSIRIVHVDDDNEFAELNSRSLRRAGFSQPVTRCSDGLVALHYFSTLEARLAPHVILLDLHMPGMNGLEVLRWLRENHTQKDVAVYLLTSSEDPEHKRQAGRDRVTEFLLKSPFADKLIEKLDKLIEMSNHVQATKLPPEGGLPPSSGVAEPLGFPLKMACRAVSLNTE